jgi:MerR family mercuric resistance operon transcriptional regulator
VSRYTIGALAAAAGVSVETVRFYERRGLVEQPARPGGGYRRYPDEALDRLRFIRRAKDLGFTLAEIAELLVAAEHGSPDGVLAATRATLARVEQQLDELGRQRDRLQRLAQVCAEGEGGCITLAPCAG